MFDTIIWASDGSAAADLALSYAKSLADEPDRRLIAVHCKELLVGRVGGVPLLANEPDVEEKIRAQVDAALLEGIDASFHLVTAAAPSAAHAIAEVARELAADAIVVGTRGHTPMAGLLLGSVTQRLLHIAPCPVVAVPARKTERTREHERPVATTAS
jgi:nucleotide-binding universal stress UspA family protein